MSDWRADLEKFFTDLEPYPRSYPNDPFFRLKVHPVFEEIKEALNRHGRKVEIEPEVDGLRIAVSYEDTRELHLSIRVTEWRHHLVVQPTDDWRGGSYESFIRGGINDYTVDEISKDEIRDYVLNQYKDRVRTLSARKLHSRPQK